MEGIEENKKDMVEWELHTNFYICKLFMFDSSKVPMEERNW